MWGTGPKLRCKRGTDGFEATGVNLMSSACVLLHILPYAASDTANGATPSPWTRPNKSEPAPGANQAHTSGTN